MRKFLAIVGLTATILVPKLGLANESQFLFDVQKPGNKANTPVLVLTDDNGDVAGLKVGNDSYSAAQLRGDTLIHIDGVKDSQKVLYLNGSAVNVKTGGNLTMRYLHDGTDGDSNPNKYHRIGLTLARNENNSWSVKVNGRNIKSLKMTNNSVIILGTIGIDTVTPIFASLAKFSPSPQAVAYMEPDAGISLEKLSDSPAVKVVTDSAIYPDGGVPDEKGKTQIGS